MESPNKLPGAVEERPIDTTVTQQQPSSVWSTQKESYSQDLEYLTKVNQLLVQQKIDLIEAFMGCEMKNKYDVNNSLGQPVFRIQEDTDCCTRNCCGPARPFHMDVVNHEGRNVLQFDRPLACSGCCCPCCLMSLNVKGSQGELLGSVQQDWSIFTPSYSINDWADNHIFTVKGRTCMCYCCCSDMEFPILLKDGKTQVGKITKQWSGFGREAFTNADHFSIEFPMDLDVRLKAVLLGATMLVDFMHFESK